MKAGLQDFRRADDYEEERAPWPQCATSLRALMKIFSETGNFFLQRAS